MEIYGVTLGIALVFIVIEILVGGFLFLGFAVGLSLVAVAHFVTTEAMLARDLIIFSLSSGGSFYLFRKYFQSSADDRKSDHDINRY